MLIYPWIYYEQTYLKFYLYFLLLIKTMEIIRKKK